MANVATNDMPRIRYATTLFDEGGIPSPTWPGGGITTPGCSTVYTVDAIQLAALRIEDADAMIHRTGAVESAFVVDGIQVGAMTDVDEGPAQPEIHET